MRIDVFHKILNCPNACFTAGKKGTWISWVLFVGLVVALSSVMFFWAKTTTTESAEHTFSAIEVRDACRQVMFSLDPDSSCATLFMTNRGTLNIAGFALKGSKTSEKIPETLAVNENHKLIAVPQSIQQDLYSSNAELTIIPLIQLGKGVFGCSEKKVIFECPA